MRVRLAVAAAALVAVGLCPLPARGEVLEKTGTFAGLRVTYKVVLPAAYDASKTYPLVLVFTGGPQTLQIATSTVEADWRAEAERRGYIVVAPASPNGELFFEGADRIFPSFLDQMLRDYHVGKVHVVSVQPLKRFLDARGQRFNRQFAGQKADRLALLHLEGQPIDGDGRPIAFLQADDFDGLHRDGSSTRILAHP